MPGCPYYLLFGLLSAIVLFPGQVSAQTKSPAFYLEAGTSNDFYALRQPSDRYFTSGKTLRFNWIPRNEEDGQNGNSSLQLGLDHRLYTPYRIQWSSPQQIDRPYASMLLLRFQRRRHLPTRRLLYTSGLLLGWAGPSVRGEELQNWFHRLKGRPQARGWAYQLRDQPVIGVEFGLEKGLSQSFSGSQLLLVRGRAVVNTLQQHLDLGMEYRLGDIEQYFRPLPDRKKGWQCTAYFRLGPRLVFGNQIITGALRSPVADAPLARQPLHLVLLRGEYGLDIRRDAWRLRLTQTVLSPEYRGGTTHYRGEIALGYLWHRRE